MYLSSVFSLYSPVRRILRPKVATHSEVTLIQIFLLILQKTESNCLKQETTKKDLQTQKKKLNEHLAC